MLTWLDLVLLAIVGVSALTGVWRGLIGEVMALVVWVAAFWLAIGFGPQVAELYTGVVDAPTARWLLGYASVFLLVLAIGGLVTWVLRKLVRSTGLSGSDRVLGLGFGLVRGAVVACVLVLVAGFTPLPQEAAWQQAQLVPGFERGARWLQGWLPQVVAEHVSFAPAMLALPSVAIPLGNQSLEATPQAPAAATPDPSRFDPGPPGT